MKRAIWVGTAGWAMGAVSALASWPLTSQAQEAGQEASLEEIVVTARKRVESLEDTPVSITAFSSNEVSMRGATDINDLLRSVPNVTTDNNLTIRGIGYNTRNIGIEAGATVYIDGVYTGRPDSFNQNLTDVRGIEILRGPQGTLFGKNSIAGVISITTQQPVLNEWSAHVLGSTGNQDESRAQLTVNAPIGSTAALRVSVGHDEIGGDLLNLYNGSYFNGDNNTSLRAALRWEPSDALEITLRANYLHDHNTNKLLGETATGVDPQTPPPRVVVAPGPFTTMENTPTHAPTNLKGLSATLQYRVSEAFTLTSVTGFEDNKTAFAEGEDQSALDIINISFFNHQRHITQEVRGSGTIGDFDYVTGLYYFHQNSNQANDGILGTDFAIPGLIPGGSDRVIDPRASIITKSYAAFFDVTYKLMTNLELEVGGRFNRETKDFAFQVASDVPVLFYQVPYGTDSLANNDFSPTAGLRYHINDELMTYARYAKGYKSGGWNADFASAIPGVPAPSIRSLRFDPENASTYELGFKSEVLNRMATFNVALFYTNYSNLQVAQFNGINLEAAGQQLATTSNAGQATIKGVEVEGGLRPTKDLQFSWGLGYQSAVYDRFDNAGGPGVSAAGKEFAYVPRWTANMSGQYGYPLPNEGRLLLRADSSFIGKRYGDVLDDPFQVNKPYWVVNARFGYMAPADKWQVFLWSNNVTNHFYEQWAGLDHFAFAQSSPVRLVSYGRPRTFGVEVQADF